MSQTFSVSQQANWSWSSRWRSMRVVLHLGVLAASCHGWDGKWQPTGIWVLARIWGARRGEFYPAWSHTGWTGHPLAFVFTHLSDLQDLPTPPGFSSTLPFIYFFFSQTPFFLQTTSLGNPSAEPPPPFATWDPWFSKSHWSVHAVCLYWWCSHVSSIIGFATLTGFRHYQNLQPAHTGSSQQEACLCLKVWNSVLDISTPPPPSPVDPIICCIMLFSLSCFSPTSVAHFSARAGEDLHSYCLFLFLLGPLPSESRHNHPQSLLQQVSVHLWVLRRVILRAVWPILARAIYAVCLAGSINIL